MRPSVFLFPEHHDAPACIQQKFETQNSYVRDSDGPPGGVEVISAEARCLSRTCQYHPEFAEECARLGCR